MKDVYDLHVAITANTHVLPTATTTSDNRDYLTIAATTNPIEVIQTKPQSIGKSNAMRLIPI